MYVWLCVWSSNDLWTACRQIEFAFFVTLLQTLLPQFIGYLKYLTVNYLFFVNGPKTGLFKFLWTFVAFTVRGQDCLRNDASFFLMKRNTNALRAALNTFMKETDTSGIIIRSQTPWERQVTNSVYRELFLCALQVSRVSLKTTNLKTIFLIIINQCLTNWKYSILEAETD